MRPTCGATWAVFHTYGLAGTRRLQFGWLLALLIVGGLAVAATPALHTLYRSHCCMLLCEPALGWPSAATVAQLARFGVPLRAYATPMVTLEWGTCLLWATLGAVIIWRRPRDTVGLGILAHLFREVEPDPAVGERPRRSSVGEARGGAPSQCLSLAGRGQSADGGVA